MKKGMGLWACTKGCGSVYPSRAERNAHERDDHADHAAHAVERTEVAVDQPGGEDAMPLDEAAKAELKTMFDATILPITQALQELAGLPARLQELEGMVKAAQEQPSHPIGLCRDESCPACPPQVQQIAAQAFTNGQKRNAEKTAEYLARVGGEPLRQEVAEKIAEGRVLLERDARAKEPLTVIR